MTASAALKVYDVVLGALYKAEEKLADVPPEFRHAQFIEATKALFDLCGLVEDLQYEAGMEASAEADKAAEDKERKEYERLKAKFGA